MIGSSSSGSTLVPTTPCQCQQDGPENQSSNSCPAGTYTPGGGCNGNSVLLSNGSFSFRRKLLSIAALNGISWEFNLDYLSGNGVNDILGKGFNYPHSLRLLQS